MRRKLLCISAAMIIGIWCARISWITAAGISLAAVFYMVMLYVRPEYDEAGIRPVVAACVFAIIFGAARFGIENLRYSAYSWIGSGNVHELYAEVIQVEKENDLLLRVIKADGRNVDFRCLTDYRGEGYNGADSKDKGFDGSDNWLISLTGAFIRLKCRVEVPESRRNPRCFDYSEYLRSRGIGYVAKAYSYEVIKRNSNIILQIKRELILFRERLTESIPGDEENEEKALIRGVLFGDTDCMEEDLKEDFRRNGTAHILAVSGLHIGLLYAIFRKLRKVVGSGMITPCFYMILALYGTMTLWTVSVTRACAMIILMETGEKTDRRYDLLTSLGFVSMLVLIHNPYAMFGASFLMSYLAVLSMGLFQPVLERKLPEWLPGGLVTSISVQMGLLPYTVYTFNVLPIAAVIINIPTVMILTALVTTAALSVPFYAAGCLLSGAASEAVLSCVSSGSATGTASGIAAATAGNAFMEWIMTPLFTAECFMAKLIILINRTAASLKITSPDVTSPKLYVVFALYAAMIWMFSESFRVARIRKDRGMVGMQAGVMLMCVMLSALMSVSAFDKAAIIMVDVGQGDCMHFRFRNSSMKRSALDVFARRNVDVMIDGGGSDNYDTGKKTLKPYLLKNGVADLDLAIATHLHTDHYKGITDLIEVFPVKRLIVQGKAGDVIRINRQEYIEVLWPVENRDDRGEGPPDDNEARQADGDENKNSMVLKVHINGITVLVTGDLTGEDELEMVRLYSGTDKLKCDVLKVSHHGSRFSSTTEFLEAVSPRVALIGAGENNTYGHPSDEALERLKNAGIRVYRTDKDGAIGIIRKKDSIAVCTGVAETTN